MNLFENIGVKEDRYHEKFKILKNILNLTGEQDILNDWVTGFEDRDNKIVKEFQTTFHSSFFEFFLFALFKEAGFSVDFTKNRPDFIITKPLAMYIEAVVSNIKKDGRGEDTRTLDDIFEMIEPPYLRTEFYGKLDESIVRHSNAVLGKSKKYLNEYVNLDYINKDVPYVIALSAYDQVNYGNQFYYPMAALLYGYYYNTDTENYEKRDFIIKPNTKSEIPIGLFNDSGMEHISAIIFSSVVTLGKLTSLSISQNKSPLKTNSVMMVRHGQDEPHYKLHEVTEEQPEYLSDGVFVFHNPNAKNRILLDVFDKTNVINISCNESGMSFSGNNLPIVSRFNMLKHLVPHKELIYRETFLKFNRNFRMSEFDVLEIDLRISPAEITLLDREHNLPFIVDLFDDDIETIRKEGVRVKDLVLASIRAKPDEFGNTVQWLLHSIKRVNT